MNYAQIRDIDISDGPGIRVGFYTQGCDFRCKGCYNESTWDYNSGTEWTYEINNKLIELMKPNYIKGISILGGDPICSLIKDKSEPYLLLDLVKRIKEKYDNKSIWLWTGFLFENIVNINSKPNTLIYEKMKDIIKYLDVIVDGKFDMTLKDFSLKYCGSINQRVIDVKKSLEKNEVILYK